MRPARAERRRIGAAIASFACLLGGSPAQEAAPSPPAPAPACEVREDAADAAAVAAMIEALKRRPPRRPPEADAVVGLDNRGYAYGAAPHPLADLPSPDER